MSSLPSATFLVRLPFILFLFSLFSFSLPFPEKREDYNNKPPKKREARSKDKDPAKEDCLL